MGTVLSFEKALGIKVSSAMHIKLVADQNQFQIAMERGPEEDKGLIYTLFDEYGLNAALTLINSQYSSLSN